MSGTVPENVARRIASALNLARNAGTEGEAEAAMAAAQNMMAKYNLTMAMVEARHEKASAEDEEGAKRNKVRHQGKALYDYQRKLMRVIADCNFCFCYLIQEQRGRRQMSVGPNLIGRQANVVSATIMFDYLNETLERLVPVESNAQRLSRAAISWKFGAAERLGERLQDRKWELERSQKTEVSKRTDAQKAEPGGLILLENISLNEWALNLDFTYGYEPGTTTRERLEAKARARQTPEVVCETPVAVPETDSEKVKREAEDRKWRERYERRERAFWANKDMNAVHAGRAAGDKISIDAQVTAEQRSSIK